ncbi:MAG: LacI family DNA-binding transcriptional regulator [Eubacterium sp.]|nr:LacI family DNA-binding transcriptional regulator [Eubacterium sp.]
MKKSVTLADIGQRLGVSTVTVSKALSGQGGVSDELRQKIITLAGEMGYRKAERTVNTGEHVTIGVIVAERYLEEMRSFYWKLYQELAAKALAKECFTLLEVVDAEAERTLQIPGLILQHKADGLIVMGAFSHSYVCNLAEKADIPLVALDTTIENGKSSVDAVVSDNMHGAYIMTNYLFSLGHRDIGFVGTVLATQSIEERFLGFMKARLEHGESMENVVLSKDRDMEKGVIDMDRFFHVKADRMPTAFFCNCDVTAQRLICKLESMGYRVPEDISVVGFDNFVVDNFNKIGITTYEINTGAMAAKAVHVLRQSIRNPAYSNGISYINGKFILRESARKIGPPIPFVFT